MNSSFLGGRFGMILTGAVLGIVAAVLVYYGNPANMGLCAACFIRDTAGALNLHTFGGGRYIRPELLGLIFGAAASALIFGEFKFKRLRPDLDAIVLGAIGMSAALIFLGCPWRVFQRLAGGDLSALAGLAGLVVGIALTSNTVSVPLPPCNQNSAEQPEKPRFNLRQFCGGVSFLFFAVILLVLALIPDSPALNSLIGPGSKHAPFWIAISGGLVLGFLIQRSRFCTIGAFRNIILMRNFDLFWAICAFFLAALACNYAFNDVVWSFTKQPLAHNQWGLNFCAMLVAGMAFNLSGACPGRHITRAGEGDGRSMWVIIGMVAGATLVHAWGAAATPAGGTDYSWLFLLFSFLYMALFFRRSRT